VDCIGVPPPNGPSDGKSDEWEQVSFIKCLPSWTLKQELTLSSQSPGRR
jgi:hypothetical protein